MQVPCKTRNILRRCHLIALQTLIQYLAIILLGLLYLIHIFWDFLAHYASHSPMMTLWVTSKVKYGLQAPTFLNPLVSKRSRRWASLKFPLRRQNWKKELTQGCCFLELSCIVWYYIGTISTSYCHAKKVHVQTLFGEQKDIRMSRDVWLDTRYLVIFPSIIWEINQAIAVLLF